MTTRAWPVKATSALILISAIWLTSIPVAAQDLVAVSSLSGGNQQKTVLARWLAISPDLLILDEPTHGVDVGAKADIYQLMQDLAAEGLGIILISSELPEILSMSDRIVVMHQGRVAGVLDGGTATENGIMELATGVVGTAA